MPTSLHYPLRRMVGRDPHEHHRAATPLELFFDLTFVLAFGRGAAEYAHAITAGHLGTGLIGFAFASFAICWAWINFSWFASAYDTDDWLFRVTTMVQIVGVMILCLGIPTMFASLESGPTVDNSVMVLGYIVMRLAMVAQWLRAAKHDPLRRATCLAYATAISVVQIGWVVLLLLQLPIGPTLALTGVLLVAELAGPVIAESKGGTPWHAHHIVERYGLVVIIALGEGLVGTIAVVSAAVTAHGWTVNAALVCVTGIGLTFGMWWSYFILPTAPVLHARRDRAFVWGYSQILMIAAIVAVGAGLDVAAYAITGESKVSNVLAISVIAVPLVLFLIGIGATYAYLLRSLHIVSLWIYLGIGLVVALTMGLVSAGVPLPWCLMTLMLAPIVLIVGYEMRGHLHTERMVNATSIEGSGD